MTPYQLLRYKRNVLLRESDFRVIPGYPHLTPESRTLWLEYRQALRDLPQNSNPQLDRTGNLVGVTWPIPPQ
jgi:hypothetical protein